MNIPRNIPEIENRFLMPEGWREHSFFNEETGHRIHYGSAFPSSPEIPYPKAVIVCLGGLSEFSEKYYETARYFLERGYAFWFMDWAYQGRSNRNSENPHKRHSDGYNKDVSDLYKLVKDYVKPSSVHPDRGRIPLVMLAHSMGGLIGLRFLMQHPGLFDAAAFSAPLLGIKALKPYPKLLLSILLKILIPLHKSYIPGGSDWTPLTREEKPSIFCSDEIRAKIHNAWCITNPELQIGSPTLGWIAHTISETKKAMKPNNLKKISVPVLIADAEHEKLVDNEAIETAGSLIPECRSLFLADAYHEILMEKDQIRNQFLNDMIQMLEDHGITELENLKPF